MRLAGKKVIVTGANRSIGKAIALLFAKEGAEIVISYRSDKKGAEEIIDCIQKINGNARALYADFSTHFGFNGQVRAFSGISTAPIFR
jgi:NAD(P)-dependent dehydrogenase (short-subunit alcohol dehydrogenase family)